MATRTRTRTFTRTYSTLEHDGVEVELGFPPNESNDPLVHRVGDKLVVAYLSHDDDCSNPMENADCQGDLYTRSGATRGVVTDNDSELRGSLGLNSYGEPNEDAKFQLNGVSVTLLELAVDQVYKEISDGHLSLEPFKRDHPEIGDIEKPANWLRRKHHRFDTNGGWLRAELMDYRQTHYWEEVERNIDRIYMKHWREIVGPYVVPVSYFSERGFTRITTTTWDGDTDELPDGVWVADTGSQENIDHAALPEGVKVEYRGAVGSKVDPIYAVAIEHGEVVFATDPVEGKNHFGTALAVLQRRHEGKQVDLITAATKYAETILEEYSSWCEGDCWGCVVEVHELQEDGTWQRTDSDECWGHIGIDYAGQTLHNDYFTPMVERLTAETTA